MLLLDKNGYLLSEDQTSSMSTEDREQLLWLNRAHDAAIRTIYSLSKQFPDIELFTPEVVGQTTYHIMNAIAADDETQNAYAKANQRPEEENQNQ